MMDIWNERRFDLITKHKPERQNFYVPKSVKPIRLNECHDFLWSNTLWSEKAHKAWILVLKMTVSYLVLGYLTVAYLDPSIADGSIVSLNGWYFMSATMFTVGLGDFAPELMLTRAFAIIQIPFGLFIVSFALAGLTMVRNAKPKPLKKDSLSSRVTDARRLFKMIDTANTGVIERSDVLKKARECLDMSQEDAGALFDSLDLDLSGTLEMHEIELQEQPSRWDSIPVRLLIMLAKLYFTISICAIFFKQHSSYGSKEDFTWVDCFYFATVIATSIGGSICCCLSACSNKLLRYFLPGRLWRHHTLNEYGKDFSHFYFMFSTIVVGSLLSDLINLYVNDYMAEKVIAQLIESTIWVHKIDVGKRGIVTEADYCVLNYCKCTSMMLTFLSGSLIVSLNWMKREEISQVGLK
jgi:hypothetical protein